MGNRAVITTPKKDLGVYLHWNGGRDSVEAFLAYCNIKHYRNPNDDCYGWARLCQVIGNFFGGTNSIGIDKYERLDTNNGDNGVYIIDENWQIIGREFCIAEYMEYDLFQMLMYINFKQPYDEQVKISEIIEYVVSVNAEKYTTTTLLKIINNYVDEAKSDNDKHILEMLETPMKELKGELK